jgi:flagellar motor switch protein FliG
VAKIVRAVDQAVLITALQAAALKGRTKPGDFILANMSQRMAAQIREEMEALGKVKDKDGEDAMSAVVATIRELEAAGEIFLIAGED